MTKRKYKPGRKIKSFERLFHYLDKDSFVYLRDKIHHKGWVISLQVRVVKSMLKGGSIRIALKLKQ